MENSREGGRGKNVLFHPEDSPSYPRYSYVTETLLFQQVSNQIRIFLQHTLRNFILVKFNRYVERGKTRYSLLLGRIKNKNKNKNKRKKRKFIDEKVNRKQRID